MRTANAMRLKTHINNKRTTMDLDTTVRRFDLARESAVSVPGDNRDSVRGQLAIRIRPNGGHSGDGRLSRRSSSTATTCYSTVDPSG